MIQKEMKFESLLWDTKKITAHEIKKLINFADESFQPLDDALETMELCSGKRPVEFWKDFERRF